MKKIPTLFKREFKDHKVVGILLEFTNSICADGLYRGTPTIKFDGSCCAIFDGKFYKRYDAKKGKPIPENAIKCQEEADPVTGHLPCWVPVDKNNPADKWFVAAYKNVCRDDEVMPDGTYEAIGTHFQGNPYNMSEDSLIPHGMILADDFELSANDETIADDMNYIREYLALHEIEGIVFWLDGEPVCKIKRTDFGLEWPVKEKESRPEFLTKCMNIPVEEETE